MNQFRRRLFPSCAFRSRIFASFEGLADFAANFSQIFNGSQISRRVFSGVLKSSQISQISQILKKSQNGMNLFVTVYRVAVI